MCVCVKCGLQPDTKHNTLMCPSFCYPHFIDLEKNDLKMIHK